jgi:hypothetical protein
LANYFLVGFLVTFFLVLFLCFSAKAFNAFDFSSRRKAFSYRSLASLANFFYSASSFIFLTYSGCFCSQISSSNDLPAFSSLLLSFSESLFSG